MLFASDILSTNIQKITNIRRRAGDNDPSPTISDLEKTHLVYFYSSFSPIVAIAYEYIRATQTGTPTSGGDVQFSIPLVGDLFTDTVIRVDVGAVTAENTTVNNKYLQYVDFFGERLFKKVIFSVNGNTLDQYDTDITELYRKFQLMPWKEIGWNRLIGQENPIETRALALNGRAAQLKVLGSIVNGLQTPKTTHAAFSVEIPLLFWYCSDPRESIPSVSIPYGQRQISISLEDSRRLLQYKGITEVYDTPGSLTVPNPTFKMEMWINNVFVQPDVHDILIQRIQFSLVRVFLKQHNELRNATDRIQLTQFKWPVETIYLGVTPNENLDPVSPKMLTDWHKYHKVIEHTVNECCSPMLLAPGAGATLATAINTVTRENFLTGVPGPIPYTLSNGFNVSAQANALQAVDPVFNALLPAPLGLFTGVLQWFNVLAYLGWADSLNWDASILPSGLPNNGVTFGALINSRFCDFEYDESVDVIDTITIVSHGTNLYFNFPSLFYNAYIPWKYGCDKIRTPDDIGAFMIPFNFFPGQFQPSGHFNFSRARETYIEYSSSLIDSTFPCELNACAICLNFLLISDGTAIIRYGT
jgi:hypothetical protein